MSFLFSSINYPFLQPSQLQFRPFISSFAQLPDVGETVFAIRNQMQANQPRLGGSPTKLFATLQDFAGEIVRRRQLMRDRKRAQTDRVRAAEGVAARAERRAALQYSEQLNQRVSRSVLSCVYSYPNFHRSLLLLKTPSPFLPVETLPMSMSL